MPTDLDLAPSDDPLFRGPTPQDLQALQQGCRAGLEKARDRLQETRRTSATGLGKKVEELVQDYERMLDAIEKATPKNLADPLFVDGMRETLKTLDAGRATWQPTPFRDELQRRSDKHLEAVRAAAEAVKLCPDADPAAIDTIVVDLERTVSSNVELERVAAETLDKDRQRSLDSLHKEFEALATEVVGQRAALKQHVTGAPDALTERMRMSNALEVKEGQLRAIGAAITSRQQFMRSQVDNEARAALDDLAAMLPPHHPVRPHPYRVPTDRLPPEVKAELRPDRRLVVHSWAKPGDTPGTFVGFNHYSLYDAQGTLVFDHTTPTEDHLDPGAPAPAEKEAEKKLDEGRKEVPPPTPVPRRTRIRARPPAPTPDPTPAPDPTPDPGPTPHVPWDLDVESTKIAERLREPRSPYANPGGLGSKIEIAERMPDGLPKQKILEAYEFQIEKYKKDSARVLQMIQDDWARFEREVRASKTLSAEGKETLLGMRDNPAQLYIDLWWHVRVYVDPAQVNGVHDIYKVQPRVIKYLWKDHFEEAIQVHP